MTESNIILYGTEDGKVNVDVLLKDEGIWLTQKKQHNLENFVKFMHYNTLNKSLIVLITIFVMTS